MFLGQLEVFQTKIRHYTIHDKVLSSDSLKLPYLYLGDSWRVVINGTASINAHVFDYGNGTYEVLFLCEDEGEYTVNVFLDYSMCNGLLDPPDDWFIKGWVFSPLFIQESLSISRRIDELTNRVSSSKIFPTS